MANKRPGYTRCEIEMPDELVEALDDRCEKTQESRACVVNKAVDSVLRTSIPIEKLCPTRGRPPATPPAPAKKRKK